VLGDALGSSQQGVVVGHQYSPSKSGGA
jgi:hypothetical protein